MLSRCFLDFSVGVRASVIGLSQISSFSLTSGYFYLSYIVKTYRIEILSIKRHHNEGILNTLVSIESIGC